MGFPGFFHHFFPTFSAPRCLRMRLPPGLGAGGGGASPSEGRRDGGTSQTEGVGTTQWAMAIVTMVVMGWVYSYGSRRKMTMDFFSSILNG